MVRIAFVGDICPGGVLHGSPSPCLSPDVSDYLRAFDVRVGTLESAIGDEFGFDHAKMEKWANIIYSRDEDVRRLREIGIDVVSLANNHSTDLGPDGLQNTFKLLRSNGIKYLGAGNDTTEANAPLQVEVRGRRVAFLAFYDTKVSPRPASEDTWGVSTSQHIVRRVQEARQSSDYVVVLPHWGFEHSYRPLPADNRLGKRLIRAGADAVIGSHTHHVQPWMAYRGRPVFFSLGNFLFPDFYQQPPCPMWYPDDSVHTGAFPTVHEYRSDLKEPVKFVWKGESRIGLIAEVCFSDTVEFKGTLTYLDERNTVVFLPEPASYVRQAPGARAVPTVSRILPVLRVV